MSNKVELYIVRHGKTIFNTIDRVQGWCDSPLTEEGIEVTQKLGRGLQDEKFTAVFTSTSGRTRETADIIMALNKHNNVYKEEIKDLREWYFGSFEGDYNKFFGEEIRKASGKTTDEEYESMSIPEMADSISKSDPEGLAHNWEQNKTRIQAAIEYLTKKIRNEGGGKVLVISHGLTISAISYIYGRSVKIGVKNASVTKLSYNNNKYVLEFVGDMSYAEKGEIK